MYGKRFQIYLPDETSRKQLELIAKHFKESGMDVVNPTRPDTISLSKVVRILIEDRAEEIGLIKSLDIHT